MALNNPLDQSKNYEGNINLMSLDNEGYGSSSKA